MSSAEEFGEDLQDAAGFFVRWRWLLGALLGIAMWVATVQAAVTKISKVQDRVDQDHEIVTGLGRLACLKDHLSASAAGIPCRPLLDGTNR